MSAQAVIRAVDRVSYFSGKAFAWLIVALTFVVSVEVFKRYILNAPTAWVYHFKTVIPIAGALVMLQGLAEIVWCFECLRTGAWPSRLSDVEEIDVIDTQLSKSEYVDEESRRVAMDSAKAIDEAARHRTVGKAP